MNEHYLEWLFLRRNFDYWFNTKPKSVCRGDTYSFQGKLYDIQKMEERYIELTKELLLEYEL